MADEKQKLVSISKKEVKPYIWKGKNKQGKELKGETEAANEAILRAFLTKQGLTQVVIREKPKDLWTSKGTIRDTDIIFFTRQMETMLRAGMPVLRALDLVGQSIEKPKIMQEMVFGIYDSIQNGSSFAEALSKYPIYFNELYVSLVAAGENAGMLEQTMGDIALNLEKSAATMKKIKKALQYPMIVMVFAVVVTAILLIKVVPVFAEFFTSNGGQLPALTMFVVKLSDFMVNTGIYIMGAIVFAIMAFIYIKKRNKKVKHASDRFALKLPLIGEVLKCGSNARFARTMSTMFNAGVSLMKALTATAPATGNIVYEEALYDVRDDVQNGQQMSFAMKNTGLFPTIAVQMTAIGEESGNLGEMLGRVAKFYEEELDWRIDNLTAMIEPMIMAFLAIVVGGLLVAMYMPIFYMGQLF